MVHHLGNEAIQKRRGETKKKALSPIRVDEILVMRREPSAGAGFVRIRRSPSVRGRQYVQVTEPKKNVAPLLERATDSLTLSIELFNWPAETGRSHGVLILLQHSFEMLLKAMILQSTGSIHAKGEKYTYGFDKCL